MSIPTSDLATLDPLTSNASSKGKFFKLPRSPLFGVDLYSEPNPWK